MKLRIGTLLLSSVLAQPIVAQTIGSASLAGTKSAYEVPATAPKSSIESYTVFNATPEQETALRAQIRVMHPDVLPLRIFFLPHWKYLDTARIFHLHVPAGYGSLMFTHLPSRTVFVDDDRYQGEEWLGHWIAHELGHLVTNSAKEEDAERTAREFRKRLRDAQRQDLH